MDVIGSGLVPWFVPGLGSWRPEGRRLLPRCSHDSAGLGGEGRGGGFPGLGPAARGTMCCLPVFPFWNIANGKDVALDGAGVWCPACVVPGWTPACVASSGCFKDCAP